MSDRRLIIVFLGGTIVLGIVGAFGLSYAGKSDAAAFLGIVTTLGGLLCPSPLFDVPKEADGSRQAVTHTVSETVEKEQE